MDFGQNIIIRTDVDTQIGSGHLMRCLALAQAWQAAGGNATFLMGNVSQYLENQLKSENIKVTHLSVEPYGDDDAAETVELARHSNALWVIMDAYDFGPVYQKIIKDSGLSLLLIDDTGHGDHYFADIILNQNLHADENLYTSRELYTRLLLGTHYILLRQEFLKWHEWKRKIPQVAQKVLVTLGGGDPDNVTLKAIQALNRTDIPGLEVKVIAGASNPHLESLKTAMPSAPYSLHILQNVEEMPELMAWADMAVSAGGSTCWELAFMGLPNIILILADNQIEIGESLNKIGVSRNLGQQKASFVQALADELTEFIRSYPDRRQMSARGRRVVDGNGSHRVVKKLLQCNA